MIFLVCNLVVEEKGHFLVSHTVLTALTAITVLTALTALTVLTADTDTLSYLEIDLGCIGSVWLIITIHISTGDNNWIGT